MKQTIEEEKVPEKPGQSSHSLPKATSTLQTQHPGGPHWRDLDSNVLNASTPVALSTMCLVFVYREAVVCEEEQEEEEEAAV